MYAYHFIVSIRLLSDRAPTKVARVSTIETPLSNCISIVDILDYICVSFLDGILCWPFRMTMWISSDFLPGAVKTII